MKKYKKLAVLVLCCLIISFDAGSSYCYAAEVTPAYSKGKLAWDGVAWALLSALGIATGEATGAVDYLTENVWTPLVAHLKEKWGSMCDVFIDKTNNKSYVSKDMMQDTLDWGLQNDLWNVEGIEPDLTAISEKDIHHFFDNEKYIDYLNGKYICEKFTFNAEKFKSLADKSDYTSYPCLLSFSQQRSDIACIMNVFIPSGGSLYIEWNKNYLGYSKIYTKKSDGSNAGIYYIMNEMYVGNDGKYHCDSYSKSSHSYYEIQNLINVTVNMGTGESTPAKDYAIDSGLTIPKAGEKIDDWLAAQDQVNGGSVGLLGNDVAIPSDVTGTGAAIDSLPLTIPSFADLVINGQLAIDDILSQGLVKANAGAIADTQAAAGAVAGAEDVAATGENAEANAISVEQAQTALKNLMQQGIDYIAIEIPNNFWNKIPFSIPYDIYLLIHGIFVGSSGGSKKAPRREASSGSNMPVGDPSNVGIEIDIPTVPLKYTEEKTEDTPPNFTFTLNIPYTTPSGETANFNKEFTIETARYNYFAKIIKFSIGLLWLSSVFQWLLAIFSKG